jgi:hypothetical protein
METIARIWRDPYHTLFGVSTLMWTIVVVAVLLACLAYFLTRYR